MDKLIFLHIPKAGGSSLHAILNEVYSDQTIFDIESLPKGLNTQEFIEHPEKEQFFLLKGHLNFGMHENFEPGQIIKYISFMREPVSRMVSHYNYAKRDSGHYLYDKIHTDNLDLESYVLSNLSTEIANGQTRMLSGMRDEEVVGEEHYLRAKENINSHFLFVGLTEFYNESLVVLSEILNWAEIPSYEVKRRGVRPNPISEELRLAIAKHNKYDVMLYNDMKAQFDGMINGVSDFQQKRDLIVMTEKKDRSLWSRFKGRLKF